MELPNPNALHPICWCVRCTALMERPNRMIVCPDCGNKRCPRAEYHGYKCTGSNEPEQMRELE